MDMDFFTASDWLLLTCCIAAATIGGTADWFLSRDDWKNLPAADPQPMPGTRIMTLAIARIYLSIIAGTLVWLLVVDALQPGKGPTARALLLSMLAGFAAPDIGLSMKRRSPKLFEGMTK